MSRRLTLATLAAVAGLACAGAPPAPAAAPSPPAAAAAEMVPGVALVRFDRGTDAAARAAAFAAADVRVDHAMLLEDAYEVAFDAARDPRDVARALSAQPGVRWAEPDYYGEPVGKVPDFPEVSPADPQFNLQWGLENALTPGADVNARRAWGITEGRDDVVVAVIDTGVQLDHPDLAANMWRNPGEDKPGLRDNGKDDDGNGVADDWRGWDTGTNDPDPSPTGDDHGTLVAGVIGADGDGVGVSGVARDVAIMPVKVTKKNNKFTAGRLADAIRYAARTGADIANVSLAVGIYTHSINDAIGDSPGLLIVAGAGNAGLSLGWAEVYPCEDPRDYVICVGAHGDVGARAGFSNHGGDVDLAAPGVGIRSTTLGGTWASGDGTSLATPFVSGAAALLWATDPLVPESQRMTPMRARHDLLNSVVSEPSLGQGHTFTGGRLDAFAALRLRPIGAPDATTVTASKVDKLWAAIDGTVNDRGLAVTQIGYELRIAGKPGLVEDVWWERTRAQLQSSGGKVGASLSFLQPGTTYEYRFKARNPWGTDHGAWRSFTTKPEPVDPSGPGGFTNPVKPTH